MIQRERCHVEANIVWSCDGVQLSCAGLRARAEGGGVINAVIQPEPPGLMMGLVQNGPTQMVAGNIYESLLRYNEKLEPQPSLAERWTISEDGKVYSFKLKKGVTWHDGKPFTAADVVFSIEFLKQTHPRGRTNLAQVERSRPRTTPRSCSS